MSVVRFPRAQRRNGEATWVLGNMAAVLLLHARHVVKIELVWGGPSCLRMMKMSNISMEHYRLYVKIELVWEGPDSLFEGKIVEIVRTNSLTSAKHEDDLEYIKI